MKTSLKLFGLLFILYFLEFSVANGQTCCSGGVPLANNIVGLSQGDKGTLQLSFNLDGNFLRTLKDGRETLKDGSRERTTYSGLFKANYAVSQKLALEILLSGIRQERLIQQGNFEDFTKTTGIGDAVIMGYYQYYSKDNLNLAFGAGRNCLWALQI